MNTWRFADRELETDRPVVMGILNVTPDSFSDGGLYSDVDAMLKKAEQMIEDGAIVLDIGGESTRPGSRRVETKEEIRRTAPVISAIRSRFSIPVSIDTTRFETAKAALDSGADVINDISGLRFDERIGKLAADSGCGLVLMHSRGSFDAMHSQEPVSNIVSEVADGFRRAIGVANDYGVGGEQIALDIGIGFGKTFEQNLELIAKLDKIVDEFSAYPLLVGASRKSFIGKVLGGAGPEGRLGGSLCAAIEAVNRGARIVRVHDVKETVDALSMLAAIKDHD